MVSIWVRVRMNMTLNDFFFLFEYVACVVFLKQLLDGPYKEWLESLAKCLNLNGCGRCAPGRLIMYAH